MTNSYQEEMESYCICPAISKMARHHCTNDEEYYDFLKMLTLQSSNEAISIYAKNSGSRKSLLCTNISITHSKRHKELDGRIDFTNNIAWYYGVLQIPENQIPETIAVSCVGRMAEEVFSHPYIPSDAKIVSYDHVLNNYHFKTYQCK